ncbi:glycosyltransferase [Luminiphilus syltensis]|nr:glycosyltransferase [Luminiphilus syltensis]
MRKRRYLKSTLENAIYRARQGLRKTMAITDRIKGRLGGSVPITPKETHTIDKKGELYDFLISEERLDFANEQSPVVSILLVFFNRAELSLACLKSLKQHIGIPFQLVIVDNASEDETAILLNRIDGAEIIRNDDNRGFLLACNQAAERALGHYILLLNNDAEVHAGTVESAVAAFDTGAGIGVVGGKITLLDDTLQEAGSIMWQDGSCLGFARGFNPEDPAVNFVRDVDYCSGAFMMTPRQLFRDLGGLDEAYAPAYYEETDYCARVHRAGLRIVYEPRAAITHFEFASAGKSDFAIRQMTKNASLFREKNRGLLDTRLPPESSNIWRARHYDHLKPHLLYVDDRVPHRSFGGGFPRSNDVLRALAEAGFNITLVPYNFPDEDSLATVYADIPRTVEVLLGVGRTNLNDILRQRAGLYGVVWVSRPHNMSHFMTFVDRAAIAGAQIVYDAEAIFALRDIEQARVEGRPMSEEQSREQIAKEVRLIESADHIVAVNEHEKEHFIDYGKVQGSTVSVLGHALDVTPTAAGFAARSGLLFVGNMDYEDSPNVDSIRWFLNQVWPLIRRELPETTLHLVGANNAPSIKRCSIDGVQVHGRVDDVSALYNQCRVFIAPTRYAAGVPFKVHEAAAMGLPVVASELIADQTGWRENGGLLAASSSDGEAFAKQCISLHRDEAQWRNCREQALKLIADECDPAVYPRVINDVLKALGITNAASAA